MYTEVIIDNDIPVRNTLHSKKKVTNGSLTSIDSQGKITNFLHLTNSNFQNNPLVRL